MPKVLQGVERTNAFHATPTMISIGPAISYRVDA